MRRNSGVEWLLKDYYGSDADGGWVGEYGTLDGLTAGTQGFSYVLNYGGKTRAILNAFAEKSRVTVLSTPRIMVKSGSEATIDVGTDVPTITSQSSGNDDDSKVYQQIQYRRTGTLLTVTPTVHSGRRVDLEISQEVSPDHGLHVFQHRQSQHLHGAPSRPPWASRMAGRCSWAA